jgi:hypothetical protein
MSRSIQEDHKCKQRFERMIDMAQTRLRQSPYPLLKRISCDYNEGVLVLRGRLPNYHHKQMAQESVRWLDGISEIVNEIEVDTPYSAT